MRAALIQMPVTADKGENIASAVRKIREAAAQGADFAVLPEMFCCPYDNACFRAYGEAEGGEAQSALAALAGELGIYIVAGSLPELSEGKVYNTSFVYDRAGRPIARHRKAHLFDIDVAGGQRFFESETLSPGNGITPFATEFGTMVLHHRRLPRPERGGGIRGLRQLPGRGPLGRGAVPGRRRGDHPLCGPGPGPGGGRAAAAPHSVRPADGPL